MNSWRNMRHATGCREQPVSVQFHAELLSALASAAPPWPWLAIAFSCIDALSLPKTSALTLVWSASQLKTRQWQTSVVKLMVSVVKLPERLSALLACCGRPLLDNALLPAGAVATARSGRRPRPIVYSCQAALPLLRGTACQRSQSECLVGSLGWAM